MIGCCSSFAPGISSGKRVSIVGSGGGPRQAGGEIATNIIQDEGGQESSDI